MTDNTPGMVDEFNELVSEFEESISDLHHWQEGMSVPYQAFFDKRQHSYEVLMKAIRELVESRDALYVACEDFLQRIHSGNNDMTISYDLMKAATAKARGER